MKFKEPPKEIALSKLFRTSKRRRYHWPIQIKPDAVERRDSVFKAALVTTVYCQELNIESQPVQ